jgi:hypothetical protein
MRPRLRRAGRSLIRWVGKVGGLEDRCRFQRTSRARPQLRSEGNFDWLTSRGNSDRTGGGEEVGKGRRISVDAARRGAATLATAAEVGALMTRAGAWAVGPGIQFPRRDAGAG